MGRVYRLGSVDICGICAQTAKIRPGREMSILELGGASNKIIVERCRGVCDFIGRARFAGPELKLG